MRHATHQRRTGRRILAGRTVLCRRDLPRETYPLRQAIADIAYALLPFNSTTRRAMRNAERVQRDMIARMIASMSYGKEDGK